MRVLSATSTRMLFSSERWSKGMAPPKRSRYTGRENLTTGPAHQPPITLSTEAAATRPGSLIPGRKGGLLSSLLGEERLQPYLPTVQPNDYKPQSTGKPVDLTIRLMLFAYIAPKTCNLSPYEIHYEPDLSMGLAGEAPGWADGGSCKL